MNKFDKRGSLVNLDNLNESFNEGHDAKNNQLRHNMDYEPGHDGLYYDILHKADTQTRGEDAVTDDDIKDMKAEASNLDILL
jgi:hypothetical protein